MKVLLYLVLSMSLLFAGNLSIGQYGAATNITKDNINFTLNKNNHNILLSSSILFESMDKRVGDNKENKFGIYNHLDDLKINNISPIDPFELLNLLVDIDGRHVGGANRSGKVGNNKASEPTKQTKNIERDIKVTNNKAVSKEVIGKIKGKNFKEAEKIADQELLNKGWQKRH